MNKTIKQPKRRKGNAYMSREARTLQLNMFALAIVMFLAMMISIGVTLVVQINRPVNAMSSYKMFTSYEIKPGDTLNSIAQDNISPEYRSVDEYVREVKYINRMLDSDKLVAGDHIVIPYYVE